MSQGNNSTAHWLMAGALGLIGIFVIIALITVNSQADTVQTNANIDDVQPTIDSIFVSSSANAKADTWNDGSIELNAGTTLSVHVNGTVADNNGYQDITNVEATFYLDDGVRDETCSADNNTCYKVANCTLSGGNLNAIDYNCQMDLQYYTSSTMTGGENEGDDWRVFVSVTDGDDGAVTDDTLTKDVNTLLALNIPTSIDFGTRAVGSKSLAADNREMVIEVRGNDRSDVEIEGNPLVCSVRGSIPNGNIEFGLTDVDHSDVAMTDVPNVGASTGLSTNTPYATSGTVPVQDTIYWNIEIPNGGVEGECTGNTIVSAVAMP